jgi:hypothetical protein
MVSIGKPEVGKKLIDHLNFPNGQNYLYVDPESALYEDLLLNKGIKETFFSPSTPFAFLQRLTKKDGMEELTEVLSNWNKGTVSYKIVWSMPTWFLLLRKTYSQRGLFYHFPFSHFYPSQTGSSIQSRWDLSLRWQRHHLCPLR